MKKPIIICDPYPRTLDLIFSKEKFKKLNTKFKLINVPSDNKKIKENFYNKNISLASFIIGQPNLPTSLLKKAINLKAIFNVESNFMDNMDYDFCFKNGIHVLSTSPVFAQPVAEMALGLTLSLARSIHIAHSDFVKGKEKYGGEKSAKNFLLKDKTFGLIGFGDLSKALLPLLKSFSDNIIAYDPWVPEHILLENKIRSVNLNNLLKQSDIIYVLASATSSNQGMINKAKFKLLKKNACFILMSRAAIINFNDFYKTLKSNKIYAAIDVFPVEPVKKNDPIRKLKNVVFSAHRAGALDSAFKEMGNIVYEDILLIQKNLPPKLCKRAERETVGLLRSKPVDHN